VNILDNVSVDHANIRNGPSFIIERVHIEEFIVGIQVKELRNLLSKSSLHHDHRSAKVPASSFSLSSKMLWDEIMQNKRLDLPSHKVLLDTY
jgi:hypothetical protein